MREQRRFKDTWNFDVRQTLAPLDKRSSPAAGTDKPRSPKRRYVWERQDPKDMPLFYSKPFYSPRPTPTATPTDGGSPLKRRKVHESVKQVRPVNTSPLRPLACRDENVSPNSPNSPSQMGSRKRAAPSSRLCVPLLFSSAPVNFVDTKTAPTTARVVSALRVASGTANPQLQNSSSSNSVKSETSVTATAAALPSNSRTSPERPLSTSSSACKNTPASRQLFSKRNSPSRSPSQSSTQRLITDMLPLKKNRRNSKQGSSPVGKALQLHGEDRRSSQTVSSA